MKSLCEKVFGAFFEKEQGKSFTVRLFVRHSQGLLTLG
jgi:hypothetical protein